ncbi:DUF6266 family protein [Pedobacter sp. NJ-S-72]
MKDMYVGKSLPKPSSKKASVPQLDQQIRFKMMIKFMRSFKPELPFSYQRTPKNTTAMNLAMQYNLSNAITGVYPNYVLDYANIKLSEPYERDTQIDNGLDILATALPGRKIKLTWKPDELINNPGTKPTDKAYVYFYHPGKQMFFNPIRPERSKLTLDISLPSIFVGELHGWVFFLSEDRKLVSDTQYLGKLTITA